MNSLRMNNVPVSLFESNGSPRADLVAAGRLLMYEAYGRETNRVRINNGLARNDFSAHLDDATYKKTSENHRRDLMLYCAKVACNHLDKAAPESWEDFLRVQRDFSSDATFLKVLAGVTTEIIRPMLPYVISDAVGRLAQSVSVPMGQTYEVVVGSGDILVFNDSAWGAARSVPNGELYDRVFTLNPSPRSAGCFIRWYQLVSNDRDIGVFYNSLAAGMYSYIMGLFNNALTTAAGNAAYNPSYLTFASYTTDNWVNAAKYVSQVNHATRDSIIAYGDYTAMAHVLPSGTSQDASLTFMLGEEWNRAGYLGTVMGIKTFALENVMLPGTQYTTGTQLMADDVIYMAASSQAAPVWICFEDGTPITLELDASKGTGDGSIYVNLTMSIDVKPICSSKMAVINNV